MSSPDGGRVMLRGKPSTFDQGRDEDEVIDQDKEYQKILTTISTTILKDRSTLLTLFAILTMLTLSIMFVMTYHTFEPI